MSRGGLFAITLAVMCLTCRDSLDPAGPSAPPPTPTVFPGTAKCFADLSEVAGPATVFPETLVRDGVQCRPEQSAREIHCVGVFVAIDRRFGLPGGSTWYYDGERRLFAGEMHSDYASFCGGTSFSIVYGTIPTCPGSRIVTDLCRR